MTKDTFLNSYNNKGPNTNLLKKWQRMEKDIYLKEMN